MALSQAKLFGGTIAILSIIILCISYHYSQLCGRTLEETNALLCKEIQAKIIESQLQRSVNNDISVIDAVTLAELKNCFNAQSSREIRLFRKGYGSPLEYSLAKDFPYSAAFSAKERLFDLTDKLAFQRLVSLVGEKADGIVVQELVNAKPLSSSELSLKQSFLDDVANHAFLHGRRVIAEQLILSGVKTDIFKASGLGNRRAVDDLLSHGCSIQACDRFQNTLAHYAACNNSDELLRYFIREGIPVCKSNHVNETPMHTAARCGSVRCLRLILRECPQLPSTQSTLSPLHLAAEQGDVDCVKELLRVFKTPNISGKRGWTPLHLACFNGNYDAAECLIQHGANIDDYTSTYNYVMSTHAYTSGWTALHIASQQNHLQVVKLLIANGSNTSLTTKPSEIELPETPLGVSIRYENSLITEAIVESLIVKGDTSEDIDFLQNTAAQKVRELKMLAPKNAQEAEWIKIRQIDCDRIVNSLNHLRSARLR